MPLEQVIYCRVALLAEGVDRNDILWAEISKWLVALLAEGVDRNRNTKLLLRNYTVSPSSRRAWIEIA